MPNFGEWATSTRDKMKIKFRRGKQISREQFCTNKLLKQACYFSCFARCFTILQPAVLRPGTNFLKPNNFKFQNNMVLKQNYKAPPNTSLLTQHAFQYIQKYAKCQYIPPASATEPSNEFEFWTLTRNYTNTVSLQFQICPQSKEETWKNH